MGSRHGYRAVGWLLAGLVLFGGATRASPAAGAGQVVGRVGSVTVTASSLRPAPTSALANELASDLRISTNAPASDQLDVALAAGDTAVGVYHQRVSVGEIPDLASCDGDLPPVQVVDQWLHFGPLVVPGRSYGADSPASATLIVPRAGVSGDRRLAVTLYFAHAGQLTLDVPVRRS